MFFGSHKSQAPEHSSGEQAFCFYSMGSANTENIVKEQPENPEKMEGFKLAVF